MSRFNNKKCTYDELSFCHTHTHTHRTNDTDEMKEGSEKSLLFASRVPPFISLLHSIVT